MHIREISSIRGVAAVVVLLGHVFNVIDRQSLGNLTPDGALYNRIFDVLGSAFNGPAAVEIFFVLSGLVLSLSLDRGGEDRPKWLASFYVKRVFRIFPALWVSLLLALSLLSYERSGCASGFCTTWAAGAFQDDYTPLRIVLSFLGIYVHLNAPMWSLRAELFYSLLFPAMFLLLRYERTKWPCFLSILALAVLPISRFYSVHYALAFALGAMIPILPVYRRLPYAIAVASSTAVLLFSRQALSAWGFEEKTFEIIEMGASFVIIYALFHKKIDLGFLKNPVVFYIGEISYSIYVLHFPILFALVYMFDGVIGAQAIRNHPIFYTLALGVATLAVTIGLSALNFRFVELPFQSLGRTLSERIKRLRYFSAKEAEPIL